MSRTIDTNAITRFSSNMRRISLVNELKYLKSLWPCISFNLKLNLLIINKSSKAFLYSASRFAEEHGKDKVYHILTSKCADWILRFLLFANVFQMKVYLPVNSDQWIV